MKKTALVLGLSVLTLNSCHKQDPTTRPNNYQMVSNTVNDNFSSKKKMKPPVQLPLAGFSKIDFCTLQETIGNVDIANYLIEGNTEIVLIESLNHNVNVKGFNKMVDDFNLLYASDNETLMKSYQSYADENCKKIYGCVGAVESGDYEWKIIKFLPSPEKCNVEPTITMSNPMLYK